MNALQGLTHLPARDPDSGLIHVIVDTPRGSRSKFKYDEKLGLFRLGKVLPLGTSFPYDFGFIPSTKAEDGDPVDVLVIMDGAAFCGCLVPVRLLGIIEAEQTEKGKTVRNDRIIGMVETPANRPDRLCPEIRPKVMLGNLGSSPGSPACQFRELRGKAGPISRR